MAPHARGHQDDAAQANELRRVAEPMYAREEATVANRRLAFDACAIAPWCEALQRAGSRLQGASGRVLRILSTASASGTTPRWRGRVGRSPEATTGRGEPKTA